MQIELARVSDVKVSAFLMLTLTALLLSGCWMSDKPLMPEEEMDWPRFEAVYISETWATAREMEDVVTVTRKQRHFEISDTPLFNKKLTSRYLLNFDELKPGWYLIQISPVTNTNAEHVWEDYPNHTYYRLLHAYGKNWQEFSFWPGCPDVAEELRGNLEQSEKGCSFKDYSLLRSEALVATDHLFFNPASFDPMKDSGVSSAHYERALNIHHGSIQWSKQYDPKEGMGNWLDPNGYLELLGIAVTALLALLLLTGIWLFIKWLAARRSRR